MHILNVPDELWRVSDDGKVVLRNGKELVAGHKARRDREGTCIGQVSPQVKEIVAGLFPNLPRTHQPLTLRHHPRGQNDGTLALFALLVSLVSS